MRFEGKKRRQIRKPELIAICVRQGLPYIEDKRFDWTIAGLKSWLKGFGTCEYSGEPINGQDIDFDHIIPNALLHETDEEQWQVILRKWHKVKSADDVKRIAKAKRQAGETGQYARRKRRGHSLIQGRKEIAKRPFHTPPEGYKHRFGR